VFYIHSRLLERAARLSDELGGGSITALPIIETLGGDVTSYIPTNVISITDGQIFLESDLFYNGIRPAINPGISVSRVGGSAQTKAMKKVSGKLRLELAQYRELLSFSQFGIELDREASGRLAKGERLYEILKQPQYSPIKYEKEVLILYAAINDKLNDIAVKDIKQFEIEFFEYMDTYHREIADSIRKTGDLRSDVMASLDEAIEDFKASYFK
jgi:F-type H+-transporting ATPase subunit alpha